MPLRSLTLSPVLTMEMRLQDQQVEQTELVPMPLGEPQHGGPLLTEEEERVGRLVTVILREEVRRYGHATWHNATMMRTQRRRLSRASVFTFHRALQGWYRGGPRFDFIGILSPDGELNVYIRLSPHLHRNRHGE